MKSNLLKILSILVVAVIVNIIAQQIFFRIDLTTEKRYTLAKVSKEYLKNIDNEIFVTLYLDGDLNAGFCGLRKATREMLDELNVCASHGITYKFINPNDLSKSETEEFNKSLSEDGLGGIPVFEAKEDGQKTRSIVYPYARVECADNYIWVNLLENVAGLSGDENLNRSIENIEYKLVDAIHQLTTDNHPRVAFLEGHGELDEIDVIETTDALSKFFAVDRGEISDDASVLDAYKVIIIAKPALKFTEKEKYVIDQYIMNGGRVLWLIDAVTMTLDSLRNSPHTVGLLADFNLDDMLFVYGARINPEVVEDINCGMVPISVAQGEGTKIVPMPWRFSPLLATNMLNAITKNVNYVKGDFTSYIDTVGENLNISRSILLRTSQYTKVNATPVFATLATMHEQPQKAEFNHSFLNVALLEEGTFNSVFAHRHTPNGLKNTKQLKTISEPTKMIIVADGDIIKNDVRLRDTQNPTIVPLGYDEMARQTFGNKDFIVNAVQYLADDDGWMLLRNRSFSLRLLDKEKIGEGTTIWKVMAFAIPLLFVAILGIIIIIVRRHKFAKRQ